MSPKGDGCYSINRDELLDILCNGGVIWWWKFGPMIYDERRKWRDREMHPQRRTVLRLIREGVIVDTSKKDANATQRQCGVSTYRLA